MHRLSMSLDIGDALREGAERTVARTGLLLMAGFGVLGLATVLLQQTFFEWYFALAAEMGATGPAFETPPMPLALDVPIGVVAAGMLVTAVVAEAYRIVAVRTMVGDHPDRIPLDLATRNLPLATLNGVVGGIVVAILVGLGSILVLPGIFLAISFLFVRQEIAVEDRNFVDAMVNSWELSSGSRLELLVLGIVWITGFVVAAILSAALGMVVPPTSPVGPLIGVLFRIPLVVFVVATASRAYVQLKGADAAEPADAGDAEEDPDGDEWDDPPGVDL